ncbi:hypothetical protein AVEN_249256-1 [Araneus ventricosus]|uniref:Transmembrane protein n=1 Tax=Araneus ventricosus TaxID=182803 RepID=A0A4Y2KCL3_ARAVE|nr:hypothetical protein AVEN_249256-1 [Araneus ventricosus]
MKPWPDAVITRDQRHFHTIFSSSPFSLSFQFFVVVVVFSLFVCFNVQRTSRVDSRAIWEMILSTPDGTATPPDARRASALAKVTSIDLSSREGAISTKAQRLPAHTRLSNL